MTGRMIPVTKARMTEDGQIVTDRDSLEAIRGHWLSWAKHEIDGAELAARVAETLEAAGLPVIEGPEREKPPSRS